MTTIPASPGQALAHAQRPLPNPASGCASTASVGTVDPAKLLQKYKWALLIAVVLGGVLGGGMQFALAKFYPRWRPFAYFKVDPPVAEISDVYAMQINTDEMNRFMQTEVRRDAFGGRATEGDGGSGHPPRSGKVVQAVHGAGQEHGHRAVQHGGSGGAIWARTLTPA